MWGGLTAYPISTTALHGMSFHPKRRAILSLAMVWPEAIMLRPRLAGMTGEWLSHGSKLPPLMMHRSETASIEERRAGVAIRLRVWIETSWPGREGGSRHEADR